MNKIIANIGAELYKTEIESETNLIISDEPKSSGGQDLGFAPNELLASSLAACTAITLRMYANRKGWELTDVKVEVSFETDSVQSKFKIVRDIQLLGNLDEDQQARLLIIANKCPIHKILTNPIEITTALN